MESDEVMDGYLHLLLTSGLGFNTPGNECTAYVLRSPEEVNGGILEMLHRNWLKSPAMEDVGAIDMGSMIQGLPVWNLTDLGCIADYIVKAQRDVLQAWLDERRSRSQSMCMTETEVMSILQGVHRHVMEVTKAERVGQAGTDAYKPYSLWTYAHGTSAENMDWPERQALKLQESSSRKMSRFMSSDSLQQSSPIQPTEEAEKSVNVGDFLKLFAADGSAAGTNLSILQGKEGSSVLSKISSFDDRELSWPECKDVKFHDIYYNNGRRCEKLELQYSKLKQRHLGSETRSTISVSSSGILDHSCSAIKTKAVRKVCRSPVRRSPRKHAPPRDRLSTGVIRDKRRIELCPKTSKEPGVKQKPLGDPLTQLTVERPARGLPDDKKKTGPTRRVLKEDVPPAEEPTADQAADKKKSSRSDRHKRRLQQIVHDVLKAKGVRSGDDLYKACSTKLYTVTKIYAMDLPTSRNLVADMTKIAEGQVQQVIDLEMMKRKST
ncbi:mdm2-binding protein-like isoform X2 [Liolophura sinensis]